MKNIFKNKQGFTLIELLVVIGILAVLAAIAIPSVAGLIDRANKSADNTNANEMTNAVERFVSEYELYRQDIMSGTFDKDNIDSAQSRVFNVTGADEVDEIRALESEEGLNGIRIDLDSKYAQNRETTKAIVQNYMKTNSSTFEPKQSDMTYWYNKITGSVIVAEENIDTATLPKHNTSNIEYNTSNPASINEWINLNSTVSFPEISIINSFVYNPRESGHDGDFGIKFEFSFPNPKYYDDIDISKVYFMFSYHDDSYFNIETARTVHNLNSVANKIAALNEDILIFEAPFYFNNANSKNEPIHFRIAYEYEENGKNKYMYSPIYTTTYNKSLNNICLNNY